MFSMQGRRRLGAKDYPGAVREKWGVPLLCLFQAILRARARKGLWINGDRTGSAAVAMEPRNALLTSDRQRQPLLHRKTTQPSIV